MPLRLIKKRISIKPNNMFPYPLIVAFNELQPQYQIGSLIFSTCLLPGTLLCDGRKYSKDNYPELYEVIKRTKSYSISNNKFEVPDLLGRFNKEPKRNSLDFIGAYANEEKIS